MSAGRINVDFGVVEQLVADQITHASDVDDLRSTLLQRVSAALSQIEGGMGADEHAACMSIADSLITRYCEGTGEYQRGTELAGETYLDGGTRAANVLSRGF